MGHVREVERISPLKEAQQRKVKKLKKEKPFPLNQLNSWGVLTQLIIVMASVRTNLRRFMEKLRKTDN